jgi:hypothetical protein
MDWTAGVQFPARARIFSPPQCPDRVLEPTYPLIQWVSGVASLGVKWPGRENDHSPPSRSRMLELYLHSPICLYGGVLNYLSTGTTLPLPWYRSQCCVAQTHCEARSSVLRSRIFSRKPLRKKLPHKIVLLALKVKNFVCQSSGTGLENSVFSYLGNNVPIYRIILFFRHATWVPEWTTSTNVNFRENWFEVTESIAV